MRSCKDFTSFNTWKWIATNISLIVFWKLPLLRRSSYEPRYGKISVSFKDIYFWKKSNLPLEIWDGKSQLSFDSSIFQDQKFRISLQCSETWLVSNFTKAKIWNLTSNFPRSRESSENWLKFFQVQKFLRLYLEYRRHHLFEPRVIEPFPC